MDNTPPLSDAAANKRHSVYVLVLILLIVPFMLWMGFAASNLWAWFVVPTFGLPPMGAAQCAGVICLIRLLKPPGRYVPETPQEKMGRFRLELYLWPVVPGVALLLGWIFSRIA